MVILLRILSIALENKWRLVAGYVSMIFSVLATLAIPTILGLAVDEMLSDFVDRQTLVWMAVLLFVLCLLRGLFDYGRIYYTDTLSQMVTYKLRNLLYDKWQNLSFAYHDNEHTGDLMSRATADIESMRRFINLGMVRSLHIIFMIIVVAILMMRIDLFLAMVSLIFVPILIIRATTIIYKLRILWANVQEVTGQLITILQENLSGIPVVKAFAAEEYEKSKFSKKAEQLSDITFDSNKLEASNSSTTTFFFTLGIGIILYFGGSKVINGTLTIGQLTEFIFLLNILNFPIRMSAWIINSYSRAIPAGERVFEVIDSPSPVVERPDAEIMQRPSGDVHFANIQFGYTKSEYVLDGIDLSVKSGQVTAILGAPGSGKSTLVHLVSRFYDPNLGSVLIDGIDINNYTLASLRKNIGIVAQDIFLFAATIRQNISYGIEGADLADIREVSKIAQLDEHIQSLPDGYDTWVGERGATLSGGQRQRLAIARTLLMDPPILVLDDSTSSVDVDTEFRIRKAMRNVMKNRTTFVIAHRLSTVRDADYIIVMDKGRIIEEGNHETLYSLNGEYKNIYDYQHDFESDVILDANLNSVSPEEV
ncbi:MAG: ABC transporter ATP-binding protein [Dehalococcoidia bacterium]